MGKIVHGVTRNWMPDRQSPKLSAGENLGHDICYRYKTKGIGIG
jgi:hypothetical protein